MSSDTSTNIAMILRDIASSNGASQSLTKIVKKCEKAAKKGQGSITVKTTEQDRECAFQVRLKRKYSFSRAPSLTPLIQGLIDLGFTVSESSRSTFFNCSFCYIEVSW